MRAIRLCRFSAALAIASASLITPAIVLASPAALNCSATNAAIVAPQAGQSVNGVVQIEGTASVGGDFQYYKLEFSPAGQDAFTVFGGLVRQQVTGAQLGVWDSASVPDGTYSIRLRVVDRTGNYCEAVVTGLQVQNSSPPTPTEFPTPTETEAPAAQAVVPTIAPTIQVGMPTEPRAAPTATKPLSGTMRTPSAPSLVPTGINVDSITAGFGDIFGGLTRAFLFGVMAMGGILLIVGAIFFVRRVL